MPRRFVASRVRAALEHDAGPSPERARFPRAAREQGWATPARWLGQRPPAGPGRTKPRPPLTPLRSAFRPAEAKST